MRMVRGAMVVLAAATAWLASAAPSWTEPTGLDSVTTLQVPGTMVAWPLTRGAAVYSPAVQHGHGQIFPTPVGSGYVFEWTNLSSGASGIVTDDHPTRDAITTGPGQIVVRATADPRFAPDVFVTPSFGTFYVTP